MKVTCTTKNGRMSAEIDGESVRDIFAGVSSFQEVFDRNECGKCGGDDIKFVVRNVDDNQFYELRCENKNCRAKLGFGSHKKGGGLFPKLKDEDGKWLNDNGWVKWNPDSKKEE